MYVCNCNGLTLRDVREAATAGVERPGQVYAWHGCQPQCGKCVAEVADVLRSHQDAVDVTLKAVNGTS